MNLKAILVSILSLFHFLLFFSSLSQPVERVEPPFWWTGMHEKKLQLMVYGKDISLHDVSVEHKGVDLLKVNRVENPNYLFIDLFIRENAKPGVVSVNFSRSGKLVYSQNYELKERSPESASRRGFGPEDVIYLIMPDRFANGDTSNDSFPGMKEKAERTNPDGRHGGDLKGILDHLDYLTDLGVTAIWINPFLENNMPKFSYHGYAITDFYNTDPRHGTNEDYIKLVEACHEKGIKVIMDMVFNHCGSEHWWMKDLPEKDWVHHWPEFTRTNYRNPVVTDPYASDYDLNLMRRGWFDKTMPDLNQNNPHLGKYLVQNSIWWIEYADLDGIRMDTYPYSYQDFMTEWVKQVMEAYPEFNIVGECWLQRESMTALYQGDPQNILGEQKYLPSVTDFPLYFALGRALNDEPEWTKGIVELYYVLGQDFVYKDPSKNVIFPDNHDLSRYFTTIDEDIKKYKLGLAFILTTRGIPMIYYGTEILMTGNEHDGHGFIRKDFPGGWPADTLNCFTADGRSKDQNDAFNFVRKILHWRKGKDVINSGKLKQYIPEDNVYAYFRYNDDETVMVVLNNSDKDIVLDYHRYAEDLSGFTKGREIIRNRLLDDIINIKVPARSPYIIELIK